MAEYSFSADPTRLIIASVVGIVILLLLIVKFKLHPVLSLVIAALVIGLGAGMPVWLIASTVEEGAGQTLEGIVLLIGLGSMFGGILEVSGGAKSVAQALVNQFGEKKAGIALGVTGLIVGTTVFFEAGIMILLPLAFSLAEKTGKSTLYYVIPLLAGLATGFAFIPPSAGSVLVADLLDVELGLMILVGVPTGIISLILAGILWPKFIGNKIDAPVPSGVMQEEEEVELPSFKLSLFIILIPLILILSSTLADYVDMPYALSEAITFVGTPFVALIISILVSAQILGKQRGYTADQIKQILDTALKPTAGILLVIAGGGIISEILQTCGLGDMVGRVLEESGLPLIVVAFATAALIRLCVGAAVVSMTMTASIMMTLPAVESLPPLYLAAMVLAINGGATAFSHFNDSGFWMYSSLLGVNERETLKSWTVMETIIGFTGFACALVVAAFA